MFNFLAMPNQFRIRLDKKQPRHGDFPSGIRSHGPLHRRRKLCPWATGFEKVLLSSVMYLCHQENVINIYREKTCIVQDAFFCPGYAKPVLWLIGQEIARLWERVTFGRTEIQATDPLNMIPHLVETQSINSRSFPVSVSGLNPSSSAAPVSCWFSQCQQHAMGSETVPEYLLQLGSQKLALQDKPQSQHRVHLE